MQIYRRSLQAEQKTQDLKSDRMSDLRLWARRESIQKRSHETERRFKAEATRLTARRLGNAMPDNSFEASAQIRKGNKKK